MGRNRKITDDDVIGVVYYIDGTERYLTDNDKIVKTNEKKYS